MANGAQQEANSAISARYIQLLSWAKAKSHIITDKILWVDVDNLEEEEIILPLLYNVTDFLKY